MLKGEPQDVIDAYFFAPERNALPPIGTTATWLSRTENVRDFGAEAERFGPPVLASGGRWSKCPLALDSRGAGETQFGDVTGANLGLAPFAIPGLRPPGIRVSGVTDRPRVCDRLR